MRTTTFEVLLNKAGRWYWREKAANGRIVDVSQAYTRKASAVKRARIKAEQCGGRVVIVLTAPRKPA